MWRFRVGEKCGIPDELICCNNLVVRRVGSPVHMAATVCHSLQLSATAVSSAAVSRLSAAGLSAAGLSDRSSQRPQLSATAALSAAALGDRSSQRPQLSAVSALSAAALSAAALAACH